MSIGNFNITGLSLLLVAALLPAWMPGAHARPADSLFVFECDQARFGTWYMPGKDRMEFYTPDTSYALRRAVSASGARYVNEAEQIEFWNKGDKAMISIKARKFTNCTTDAREISWFRARLQGVDFRAVGQEPGWMVEIREQQHTGELLLDYGTRQLQLRNVERVEKGRPPDTVLFKAHTDSARVSIRAVREECRDPMNGNRSSYTATVTIQGKAYRGCGRFLNTAAIDPNK